MASVNVAVVGSGIAGLGAAWALAQRHDVTVFEADVRAGGHARTVDLRLGGGEIAVDTGFIVYNERTYPHLTRLFDYYNVPTEPSDMSFSFSRPGLEYAGSLGGLLANPRHLLSARYRAMVGDIFRFRTVGLELLDVAPDVTLGRALELRGFSAGFRDDYVVPMAAAIWSARRSEILDFPARSFLHFFRNHGLIRISDRPQWRTVTGGSRAYVERMADTLGDRLRLGDPVSSIDRIREAVFVHAGSGIHRFDHVVLAVHTDQAMRMLGDHASDAELDVLKSIRYEGNLAVLHSDPASMPTAHAVWSSWNYRVEERCAVTDPVSVTYWMNRLQGIDQRHPLFVTLNPVVPPAPHLVHGNHHYAHPQFDESALQAQGRLEAIQGVHRTWFAGAWCGYGFHEDGLQSGLNVAAALGSPAPWHSDVIPMSSAPPA